MGAERLKHGCTVVSVAGRIRLECAFGCPWYTDIGTTPDLDHINDVWARHLVDVARERFALWSAR